MSANWTVTVRTGAHTRRARHGSLDEALAAMGLAVGEIAGATRRQTVNLGIRSFAPVQQVAARIELSGPGRLWGGSRGGIDIRGDGSQEAFTGRARRQVVAPEGDESALAALRRALEEG